MDKRYYEEQREKYRPHEIKLLLIAEAPPNPPPLRFFYYEKFVFPDSLYMETMSVIFFRLIQGLTGERSQDITQKLMQNKESYLKKFQANGFWLQDAVPYPLCGRNPSEAIKAIKDNSNRIKNIIEKYNIPKCVLIKDVVYFTLKGHLGVKVLNNKKIPFPGSRQQCIFRNRFGELLIRAGYNLPLG